jgi:hypothetical protein
MRRIVVHKPITGGLLAVAVALSIAGCSKEQPAEPAKAPAGTASSTVATPPHPTPAGPTATVDVAGVERAAGGKTVAEVFAEKDQLAGKPIILRGKVVKTNANIMGKNWLHVRDGSGAEGTNDLTVTTNGTLPNVGDTVLLTGPVVLNKDFGMGYKYDVMVEDALVKVEGNGG